MSKQGAPEFWTEITMLSKFRHSHLVSLIGYCESYSEMILVYEYMARGTTADRVYKIGKNDNNNIPLCWVGRNALHSRVWWCFNVRSGRVNHTTERLEGFNYNVLQWSFKL